MRLITSHGLHGYNVWDGGAGTINRIGPYMEDAGFEFKEIRYGWRGLLGVRTFNTRTARRVADIASTGDVGIGHSNGCAILHKATWEGAKLTGLVYINPALDRWKVPGPSVKWCHVWHSPSDQPVKWSRWLWFHPWGRMGADGYEPRKQEARDPRMHNFNKEEDFEWTSKAHSDVFSRLLLPYFGPLIAAKAWEAANEHPETS